MIASLLALLLQSASMAARVQASTATSSATSTKAKSSLSASASALLKARFPLPTEGSLEHTFSLPILAISSKNRVEQRSSGECTYTVYADDTLEKILNDRLQKPEYFEQLKTIHHQLYPSIQTIHSNVKTGWHFLVPCPANTFPEVALTTPKTADFNPKGWPKYELFLSIVDGETGLKDAQVQIKGKELQQKGTSDGKGSVHFTDLPAGDYQVSMTLGKFHGQTTVQTGGNFRVLYIPIQVRLHQNKPSLLPGILGMGLVLAIGIYTWIKIPKHRKRKPVQIRRLNLDT
jgi:hypothetical protein